MGVVKSSPDIAALCFCVGEVVMDLNIKLFDVERHLV